SMVGLFINTLPVRVALPPHARLIPWLQQLQAQQAQLRQYEHCPLVQIQGWSEVPRGQPLFDSILVFENYPVSADSLDKGGLQITNVRSIEQTNYPLTVVAGPAQELMLKVAYDNRRFDPETIRRMLGHLQRILESFATDLDLPLSSVPLLSKAEQRQLLVEWNDTAVPYPSDLCVHQLIEAQARRTPDTTALLGKDQALTYQQLDQQANKLAHYLRGLGVGPGTLVGLCVERSPRMVLGMLGVLKAGAAYVPLDPAYPLERLAFMLRDSNLTVLLTQAVLAERLPAGVARVVNLDTDWDAIACESDDTPVSGIKPDDPAYIIYTSGSTGAPKGVTAFHRALVNHVLAMTEQMGLTTGDRMAQFVSPSFDACAEEVYTALATGATLVVPHSVTELSGLQFLEFCEQHGITVLHLPAAFWHQWVDQLSAVHTPIRLPLKTLLVGGESPSVEKLRQWANLTQPHRFLNAYGPTEATITTTVYQIICNTENLENLARVPIGLPIHNTQVYVLDRQLQPVPIGVAGEIHIGGAGVARGYLNRPELTAQKFIADPFNSQPGAQLYKTGDLACWRPDGQLEFLGRTDDQIKLRGFRIEPGEIEAILSQHPSVRTAVLMAHETDDGDKRLVAYIVPADGQAINTGELRTFLKAMLPEYMLPSVFLTLETLPLTPNGKVDRRALQARPLPAPDGRAASGETYPPPHTPTEEILAGIYAEVLRLERVSVRDNFFERGGHSLLATQVVSRVREAFQIELPLRALFDHPSVVALGACIDAERCHADVPVAPPLVPVPRSGDLPLSFAQQRLWFLDQLQPGTVAYNIPSAVRLMGALDVPALERSLDELVYRHESLRTTYTSIDGQPRQFIAPAFHLPLTIEHLNYRSPDEREAEALRLAAEEASRPFDLARGPLLRIRLLQIDERDHIILLTMHHIVADGWSMGVFVRELAALYAAFTSGQPVPLPALPIQYADFAVWQRQWLQGDVLQAQLAYWEQQLANSPPLLELPTDRPRPSAASGHGAIHSFRLDAALTGALQALSRHEGVTLFMTLLAAFQTLLGRYSNQDDVCVGTPIANRNRSELED
ncbi:MAG: amino acid adenylation domain-containing protein, partial [Chloroflexi bacterium]|nr:amino acid adenylation domain-containing protein [Chloroflexota bacterium]